MNNSHSSGVCNNYIISVIKIMTVVVFVIILSACATTTMQERTLTVDASLMQLCPPLPLINGTISLGEYILMDIENSGMYNECRQSKQGLIDAINTYRNND